MRLRSYPKVGCGETRAPILEKLEIQCGNMSSGLFG